MSSELLCYGLGSAKQRFQVEVPSLSHSLEPPALGTCRHIQREDQPVAPHALVLGVTYLVPSSPQQGESSRSRLLSER